MPAKLIMLYPRPTDPDAFEAAYHGQHMPLMHRLVAPGVGLHTHLVQATTAGEEPPFYRVSEIAFPALEDLYAFARSEAAQEGRASAIAVSTGGPPIALLCRTD